MKKYVLFFFLLKLAVLVQFALIFAKKETTDSRFYIFTEIVFKTAVAIFIELFLFFRISSGIEFEDKVIISFGSGLLLYDAWINDFPKFLRTN